MGSAPLLAALGYWATGLGGILTVPAIAFRSQRTWAVVAAVVLGIAAIIWLVTGYEALWAHLLDFIKWAPK
jgi:uncharacterized membrane protein